MTEEKEQADESGPATVEYLPKITLKGNSYERGVQYGKHFGPYLEKFYYWFVKKEPKEVLTEKYRAVLEQMEAMTAEHFPQLLEQAKGWSDGAKIDYDKCRILVFHNEIMALSLTLCLSLYQKSFSCAAT